MEGYDIDPLSEKIAKLIPELSDSEYVTPLMAAVYFDQTDIVKVLIEKVKDIQTLLEMAIENENLEIIQLILDSNPDERSMVLMQAARAGKLRVIENLLTDADINVVSGGKTLLGMAIDEKHQEVKAVT